ncbi:Os12g0497200 [Oryza sativa Japonica Group]|uniref:Os12g0497200 protein n=1 Tax=Oryza sativa subsp. japonica TaxID=39947 RepID=A0A0P0YAC7_ORYSJ|nr:Os12g0497200 [Oryza sativa Japonica Group]
MDLWPPRRRRASAAVAVVDVGRRWISGLHAVARINDELRIEDRRGVGSPPSAVPSPPPASPSGVPSLSPASPSTELSRSGPWLVGSGLLRQQRGRWRWLDGDDSTSMVGPRRRGERRAGAATKPRSVRTRPAQCGLVVLPASMAVFLTRFKCPILATRSSFGHTASQAGGESWVCHGLAECHALAL